MSPLTISVLLLLAFGGFGWLTARKLLVVAQLRPDPRWTDPWARLRTVFVNGLLQRRMIRGEWRPGVMHAVIFLGFLTLLVRKAELVAIGFDERFSIAGIPGLLLAVSKDPIEIAVLVAVCYGFYRRLVIRPRRLEPNREALLVLGLIATIMLSDLAFDGLRFALLSAVDPGISAERAYSPIGGRLATWLQTMPIGALAIAYRTSYWLQIVTVLAFLVLLPVGEHFHIVTALPTLLFRRGRPGNVVPSVDIAALMSDETGAAPPCVGAKTAVDLTWKEGLDAFTCTECGRCKDACPTFLTGKPLSMKWVNDGLKHHLVEHRKEILGSAELRETLPPLVPNVVSDDALWACTTCGYCESACPIELEHLPRLFRLRQNRMMMDGEFPHELRNVFRAYEVQGNAWGLPAETRGDWAKALDVPVLRSPGDSANVDYLFYVGSAESFDPRGQKIAAAFVAILRAAGVKFAILADAEPTTGECVRRLGNEMLFQELAGKLVATLSGFAVKRIVTCDPHAFNVLKNEYGEFGGDWEVVHHTQLIAGLIRAGRLPLRRELEQVVLHDPCYLGRHNGEFDAPRSIVAALVKDAPLEFGLAREKAMCCGAGGGRMWMEETLGSRINVLRTEQALSRGPRIIATACPYCAVMLGDGLKALGKDESVQVRDVAELVASQLVGA